MWTTRCLFRQVVNIGPERPCCSPQPLQVWACTAGITILHPYQSPSVTCGLPLVVVGKDSTICAKRQSGRGRSKTWGLPVQSRRGLAGEEPTTQQLALLQ